MKDELYPLQQLLFEQPTPFITVPKTNTPLQHITDVTVDVRDKIAQGVLSFDNKKQAMAYLRHHQLTIISLQDALVAAMPVSEWPTLHVADGSPSTSWTAHAYHHLDHLLEYLQHHFDAYASKDLPLSVVTQWNKANQLLPMLAKLKEWMDAHNVHPELRTALSNIFGRSAGEGTDSKMTYRRMQYLHMLMKKLMQLTSMTHDQPQRALQELLYYYNLNSVSMFIHYRRRVQYKVEQLGDMDSKIELLSLILKRHNQCMEHKEFIYDPGAPTFRQQVSDWLTAEIAHWEKAKSNIVDIQETDAPAIERIIFDMSAAELSCFILLVNLAGVVKVTNKTAMFKTASQAFATAGNPTLSAEALRTAFYGVQAPTLTATLERLGAMVAAGHKRLRQLKKRPAVIQ